MTSNHSATFIFDDSDCEDLATNSPNTNRPLINTWELDVSDGLTPELENEPGDLQEFAFQSIYAQDIEKQQIKEEGIVHPTLETKIKHSLFNPNKKSGKQIMWESKHPKKCTVYDSSNQPHEVRAINKNKQWAIWSTEENGQILAYKAVKNGITVFTTPWGELSSVKQNSMTYQT